MHDQHAEGQPSSTVAEGQSTAFVFPIAFRPCLVPAYFLQNSQGCKVFFQALFGTELCVVGPVAFLRSCCFLEVGVLLHPGLGRTTVRSWPRRFLHFCLEWRCWVWGGFCALLACCSIMLRPRFLLALPASAHVPRKAGRQAGSGLIPPPPPPPPQNIR